MWNSNAECSITCKGKPPGEPRRGRALSSRPNERKPSGSQRVLGSCSVNDDAVFQSATRQAELVRTKQASPIELLRAYLDRIDRLDGRLRAFITVTRDAAFAGARRAEDAVMQGARLGP